MPRGILLEKIGLNSKDSFQLLEPYFKDIDYSIVKEMKRNLIRDYIEINGTPLKRNVNQLLDFLNRNNIKTAIATSRGKKMTNYYLEKADITNNFDLVLTGDQVNRGKPNPDIFLRVAEKLNVTPKNVVVVEDSPNGIKAAKNAGMFAVMIPDLVNPDDSIRNKADLVTKSLLDVKKLFL